MNDYVGDISRRSHFPICNNTSFFIMQQYLVIGVMLFMEKDIAESLSHVLAK